jgi:hypothetical protein
MMGSIEHPDGNLIIEETQDKSKVALLVDNRVLNAGDGEQIGVKHSQNSHWEMVTFLWSLINPL